MSEHILYNRERRKKRKKKSIVFRFKVLQHFLVLQMTPSWRKQSKCSRKGCHSDNLKAGDRKKLMMFKQNKHKVLPLGRKSSLQKCRWAEEQLCRRGLRTSGGQSAEHGPAVCPGSKDTSWAEHTGAEPGDPRRYHVPLVGSWRPQIKYCICFGISH